MSDGAAATSSEPQPVYVRMPKSLHDAVQERAAADEQTMAQVTRLALKFYLATTKPLVEAT